MIQAYLKYFSALLLFGLNGIVASDISLNSYEIVFFRTLLGSLFLVMVFVLSGGKIRGCKKHYIYLAISGMAMGTSWMFLYEAYTQIGVGIATLVYYCGPVIVMALSSFLFREHITFTKLLGFSIVMTGMFFVNNHALQQSGFSWGLLCGGLSAIMYAIMVIFNKKAKGITGLENAMFQLIMSFFTVAVFVLFRQRFIAASVMKNILPVLFLGVVNTGIGCYLYFSSIQQLKTGTVAICGYLEPLSALIFSAVFLQERLSMVQIIGAAFIIGGALWGELSAYGSKRKKN